ncbi:hypothetical protein [Streptomyces sp. PR69]|nr:hypothetical protein [Streptomyces sp. PR69]
MRDGSGEQEFQPVVGQPRGDLHDLRADDVLDDEGVGRDAALKVLP